MEDKIIEWAKELQSLAQAGLFYGKDRFDKERYQRIRDISAEMMSKKTELPVDVVKNLFCNDSGYQTPKIDTRAAIVQNGKILLVQENDGRWSLPGGWCEFDMSPVQNAVKEAKEEAGADIEVKKLIAVQTRSKHNCPEYPYEVVKIFYLCNYLGGLFEKNIETLDCNWFSEKEIPILAEEKINERQIKMCFEACKKSFWETLFD